KAQRLSLAARDSTIRHCCYLRHKLSVAAEGINHVDHRVVGFSGKRKLNTPDRVRDKLREVLSALKVSLSGKLVAMGSAAIIRPLICRRSVKGGNAVDMRSAVSGRGIP